MTRTAQRKKLRRNNVEGDILLMARERGEVRN